MSDSLGEATLIRAFTMTPATAIHGALCFTLLAVIPWQAAAHNTENIPVMNPPTNDELSASLIVNQMAILQLMQNSLNTSCAGGDKGTERRLAVLETRMDQVVEALNTLTKLEEGQGEMKRKPANNPQAMQESHTAAVPKIVDQGPIVHNDTVPSFCSGNKTLYGTVGALEVMPFGSYPNNKRCSWNLNFPPEVSVTLTWEYMNLQSSTSCSGDWVDVTRNSQSVYGHRLCGEVSSTNIGDLNLTLPNARNLVVTFHSDNTFVYKRGFKLLYRGQ